ncbi:hypothetical protein [Streptomyces telluris]|uniref:Integral membrane protein n=1 Tax=Streptomyces telluris TaxID=2720021 RepID=A0A9X2LMX7_9ACTN|nr:hypothetical protein [Streptomyces telluris]MCQ8773797.1 hypothetical protein [Streptomyces telluris]NJP75948.1 hypothetical protein [Streptomyces telluris]
MDISAARLRALRAALFTALCVTLSAGSHVLLSGTGLPLATVAVTAAAVFALAYALAGRERGFTRIAALFVPLELASDALFSAGQESCYGAGGHAVPGALTALCGGGTVGGPFAPAPGPDTAAWLLLAAHVAVGLLAAAWLRLGEAALVRLLGTLAGAALRRLLPALAAVTAGGPHRAAPVRAAGPARGAPALPLLVHSVVRRGPPPGPAPA